VAASFGKYLLENGVVSRQQLEEATQVMVVFGGRLGTILDAIYLPVGSSNFLASTATGLKLFHGRPKNAGIDGNILRHLCVEEPKEVAVLPVCLDRRVVNLLYLDNGADHLAESSLAALEVLCGTIGVAYTRLILENKRRHC
jgi:hypothetical protein